MGNSTHALEETPRYDTLRLLAEGGMGSVEIATLRKPGFQRLFALKRLRRELLSDERARAMLFEEGRVAGLVQHPNVVPVLDVGSDERGPFLVMELVAGVQLSELMKDAAERGELLDLQLVLRIMVDVARGLHAAHELVDTDGKLLDLVHRDVTPQNVLLGFDGIARVTDFGIVKVLDRESQTTTGVLKGKAGYMSPEQLQFEEIDRRSDLFSLGVVFFEMLSGQRLYRETSMSAAARRILTEPPPDPLDFRSDLPSAVVELVFELLAKKRDARPPVARDVETRLGDVIAELTLADGAFDIGHFLRERFPARYAETLEWRNLAEKAQLPEIQAIATPSQRPRARRVWMGVIAATVLLLIAVAVVMQSNARVGSATRSALPVTVATVPTPVSATPMPAAAEANEPARLNPEPSTSAPDAAPSVQTSSTKRGSRRTLSPSNRRGGNQGETRARRPSGDEQLWRW